MWVKDLLGEFQTFCWVISPFRNNADEVFCQNERDALSVDAKLLFSMVKEVAKVDVEDLEMKKIVY